MDVLRGAGISAIALDTTSFDSIDRVTRAVLTQAPRKFSVAGFSSGGYCALDLVRKASDRIDRLALVATQSSGVGEATEKPQTIAMLDAARANPVASVVQDLLPVLVADASQGNVNQVVEAMAIGVGVRGLENQVMALLNRRDSTSLLTSIVQPTLVVAGEHDALIPVERQRTMASRIKHSRFVQLDGVGHMVPIEDPIVLGNLLVEWFSG